MSGVGQENIHDRRPKMDEILAKVEKKEEAKYEIELDKEELKKRLSETAYKVTQEEDTEAPHVGEYVKTKGEGDYVCVACETALFPSDSKYYSECGWPAFYETYSEDSLKYFDDKQFGQHRIEVVCSKCGAHMGHVFDDGPKFAKGVRYCINSCSLKFNPSK